MNFEDLVCDCRERVEVAAVVEKRVETWLKWFGHVEMRCID